MQSNHNLIKDPRNHIGLTLCDAVKRLCEPLFESTSVAYFGYLKLYYNGDSTGLSTSLDWVLKFINEGLYQGEFFQVNRMESFSEGLYFWDEVMGADNYYAALQQAAGVYHGVSKVVKSEDYLEVYDFALSKPLPTPASYWFSNMKSIDDFILYFKSKAKELLMLIDSTKMRLNLSDKDLNFNKHIETLSSNLLELVNKFYLDSQNESYLTRREIECIQFYISGLTANETAAKLSISKKTVEEHFDNIKRKLGVNSKLQILSKLIGTGFEQFLR